MRVLRRNRHLLRDRANAVLRTAGVLQRNQCTCHLCGLPHDPARLGALADKQDI